MVLLIIDSSDLIIERLFNLVTETGKATAIFKATGYEEAVQLAAKIKPDLVLLDMCLPENNSADLFSAIKAGNDQAAFIFLSCGADIATSPWHPSHGVDFIFDKYHDFEQIPFAVTSIAAKKKIEYP